VRIDELPVSAERVFTALEEARKQKRKR